MCVAQPTNGRLVNHQLLFVSLGSYVKKKSGHILRIFTCWLCLMITVFNVLLKSASCCLVLNVLFDVCVFNASQIYSLTEIKGHRLLTSVVLGGNLLISVTCVRYWLSNCLLFETIWIYSYSFCLLTRLPYDYSPMHCQAMWKSMYPDRLCLRIPSSK